MGIVAVIGLPGSSAASVADRLGDALGAPVRTETPFHKRDAVHLVTAVSQAGDSGAPVVVFVDDAPAKGSAHDERRETLRYLAFARMEGRRVHILADGDSAKRWLDGVRRDGLGGSPGALRRVFLASGGSGESHEFALQFARALNLPLEEPESGHPEGSGAGWGPRYAAIAAGESWLVHTPLWHAVEYLAPRADLILHIESAANGPAQGFPAPKPEAKPLRLIFAPWLRRYPRVEAGLLHREIAHHAADAPVFHLRSADEIRAVAEGLTAARFETA